MGMTSNLTLNGTIHPDFAEVESDAGQFVIDPRQSLFFPEKRPFFLEGLEQFNVPRNLIYTRRIAKPEAALKLTGKMAGTSIGVLSRLTIRVSLRRAATRPTTTSCGPQRDLGGQSRIGMAYTDRVVGDDYNRVADIDGRVVFGKVYNGAFQLAQSYDKTRGVVWNAPLWDASLVRNGKRFGFRYAMNGIDERFRTLSGFISRRASRTQRSTIARRGSTSADDCSRH